MMHRSRLSTPLLALVAALGLLAVAARGTLAAAAAAGDDVIQHHPKLLVKQAGAPEPTAKDKVKQCRWISELGICSLGYGAFGPGARAGGRTYRQPDHAGARARV
jgi:hypothetical protein